MRNVFQIFYIFVLKSCTKVTSQKDFIYTHFFRRESSDKNFSRFNIQLERLGQFL